MKKLLIFLFLITSLKLLGQNTPTENTTLINAEIRAKVYNNIRMADVLQALDNSAQHVRGVFTAGGTDTYTVTVTGVDALDSDQIFDIRFTNANTGSATLNINSLGAKTLKKNVSTNLSAGDLIAGGVYRVAYDGTNMLLVSANHPVWGKISGTVTDQTDLIDYIATQLDGLDFKTEAVTRTTANITLSGEQTLDGVLTSADRVLVANQTTVSENGIYVSAAGAWARSTDADASAELENAAITVTGGTIYAGTTWVQTTDPVTLGSSDIVWVLLGGAAISDGDKGDISVTVQGTVWTVDNDAITYAKIQNSPELSVLGRPVTGTGDISSIVAALDFQLLGRSGSTLAFGPVNLASANAVSGILPDVNLPPYADKYINFNIQTGDYTLVLTDADTKGILMRSVLPRTLTIPPNSSVPFPIGTMITVVPDSTGVVTFALGLGVVAENSAGDMISHRQDAPVMLVKKASDTWLVWNGTPGGTGTTGDFADKYLNYNIQTSNYTLVLGDADTKGILMRSVNGMSLTIPARSSVDFPIGTMITIIPDSTGVVTFVPSLGVSVETSAGDLLSHRQDAPIMLVKKNNSNSWYLWNGTPGGTITVAGNSVLGNDGATAADAESITATAPFHILRANGVAGIGFGSIELGSGNTVGTSVLRGQNGGTDQNAVPVGGMLQGTAGNTWIVTPIGLSGRVPTSNGTTWSWQVPPGGGGGGTVTDVTGTTNRILITGTPTVSPVINISPNYVGQNTITTLGTISTGIWNASTIPVNRGGTGTTTPALVAGTNITITGTWPNNTINATGGGGGISNGGALTEIPVTTTGGDLTGSGLISSTLGNLTFGGAGTTGATRTIAANGSATDVGFNFVPKGLGGISFTTGTGNFTMTGSTFSINTTNTATFQAANGLSFLSNVLLNRTITGAGTTGAQTINKTAGTVNFAAAATTLVVTNSFVTTSSIVLCVIRTNDSTAIIKNVIPAAGSFTIRLNAAATAETSVGFVVFN